MVASVVEVNPPLEATLGLSVLDENGYPDKSPLRMEILHEEDNPGWLRLITGRWESDLWSPKNAPEWLEFLWELTKDLNPSFGHIDYSWGVPGKTAVEKTWRSAVAMAVRDDPAES